MQLISIAWFTWQDSKIVGRFSKPETTHRQQYKILGIKGLVALCVVSSCIERPTHYRNISEDYLKSHHDNWDILKFVRRGNLGQKSCRVSQTQARCLKHGSHSRPVQPFPKSYDCQYFKTSMFIFASIVFCQSFFPHLGLIQKLKCKSKANAN